ncbi:PEP-CTERM sorting domain-containing protein [Aquabacterium sp.]|uniref:PEP-CTERM sorting domain-containing protein n=1 Tax=Aquabacterium sp. TaxID=1872578 RepID=UPI003D6D3B03
MKLIQFSAVALAIGFSAHASAAASPHYKITDLGLSADFRPVKINDARDIAGILFTTDAQGNLFNHAALYSAGQLKDLGTLGGGNSTPTGLNNLGQVVGSAENPSSYRPFVNKGGTTQDLGGNYAYARGINQSGQIVGDFTTQNGEPSRSYVLSSQGQATDIGNLGGTDGTSALDINDAGAVTGSSFNSAGQQRAFIYQNGTMSDLGALAWQAGSGLPEYSVGYGINNAGQVIGVSSGKAFLYSGGQMTALVDGGNPVDINDVGQVIGSYGDLRGNIHYFLYGKDGLVDLQEQLGASYADWILSDIVSINNAGEMLGLAVHNQEYRTVLLTAVPEPTTVGLVLAGMMLVSVKRKKTRQAH